jgi:class 3 adenylate cyclase
VVGSATVAELGGEAVLESLGMIDVKGREASVEAFAVVRLN